MRRRQTQHQRHRAGFTLMEVLLVLAIILVIAAMVVPQLMGRQKKAMIDRAKVDIKAIESALQMYSTDHAGNLPEGSGSDFLKQFTVSRTNEQGEKEPAVLTKHIDPWGHPYNYEYPTQRFGDGTGDTRPAIWSNGPNGNDEQGEGDDIANWKEALKEQQSR